MGLPVSIYRSEHECDLNVFQKSRRLTIVNIDGPFEPSQDAPAAMLVKGNLRGCAKVVPAVQVADGSYIPLPAWSMFGGSYVASSDSRFGEAVERIVGSRFSGAVALHDRVENQAVAS